MEASRCLETSAVGAMLERLPDKMPAPPLAAYCRQIRIGTPTMSQSFSEKLTRRSKGRLPRRRTCRRPRAACIPLALRLVATVMQLSENPAESEHNVSGALRLNHQVVPGGAGRRSRKR